MEQAEVIITGNFSTDLDFRHLASNPKCTFFKNLRTPGNLQIAGNVRLGPKNKVGGTFHSEDSNLPILDGEFCDVYLPPTCKARTADTKVSGQMFVVESGISRPISLTDLEIISDSNESTFESPLTPEMLVAQKLEDLAAKYPADKTPIKILRSGPGVSLEDLTSLLAKLRSVKNDSQKAKPPTIISLPKKQLPPPFQDGPSI
jgi:hypothetical protein